jgi:prepilin-type processing-associated H-X9-DG protein
MLKGKKINTFLWFDGHAEEAAKFYSPILVKLDIQNLKEAAQ